MASTLFCVVFEFPVRVIHYSVFNLIDVSDLVVSVIFEWNKLDIDMHNYTSIN